MEKQKSADSKLRNQAKLHEVGQGHGLWMLQEAGDAAAGSRCLVKAAADVEVKWE